MHKKKFKLKLFIVGLVFVAGCIAAYFTVPMLLADEVYPLKYSAWIATYSQKYGVDPALVAAVILQESRFNPAARSGAGAQGLMQFMPSTAATMAKETGRWPTYDIFDAETSIEFGAAHIRDLLVKYNGDVGAALAAYNTGTGNVDRLMSQGLLGRLLGGNSYAARVQNYRKVYATMYPEELGLVPVVKIEKKDTTSEVRGFVWSQIFGNFLGSLSGNK